MQSSNKYFIYARTAVKNNTSLKEQISKMKYLAKRHNLNVVGVVKETGSGISNKRKAFKSMIESLQEGKANGILCADITRLARRAGDQSLIQHLLVNGTLKHIKTLNRDYYPTDNMIMLSVELGFANEYSRHLSQSIKKGLKTKKELQKNNS